MIIDDNVTGNGANDSVADPSPFFFLRSSVLAFFFTIGPLYGSMSVGGSALSGRKAPRVWPCWLAPQIINHGLILRLGYTIAA